MKITLARVIRYSCHKVRNSEEKILERNFEIMKKWTKNEVEDAFKKLGKAPNYKKKKISSPAVILYDTRKYVSAAIEKIKKKKKRKNPDFKMTLEGKTVTARTIAIRLVSKEAILSKFDNTEIKIN